MTKLQLILNIQVTHYEIRLMEMWKKCVISSMGKDGTQLKMSIPFYTNHILHASAF
jgi:hypothetical protein